MNLLLVEDNEDLLGDLAKGLQRLGHSVSACRSGEEAWEIFEDPEQHIDLVITDVIMDRMTGLDLLRLIKQVEPDFPVIVMTGQVDLDIAISALRLRASDFLLKPVSLADIGKSVRAAALIHDRGLLKIDEEANSRPLVSKLEVQMPLLEDAIGDTMAQIRDTIGPIFKDRNFDMLLLMMGLLETLRNAVAHGYTPDPAARVSIMVDVDVSSFTVTVKDPGLGFDWRSLSDPSDPLSYLSLQTGLSKLQNWMASVSWNEIGNEITFVGQGRVNLSGGGTVVPLAD